MSTSFQGFYNNYQYDQSYGYNQQSTPYQPAGQPYCGVNQYQQPFPQSTDFNGQFQQTNNPSTDAYSPANAGNVYGQNAGYPNGQNGNYNQDVNNPCQFNGGRGQRYQQSSVGNIRGGHQNQYLPNVRFDKPPPPPPPPCHVQQQQQTSLISLPDPPMRGRGGGSSSISRGGNRLRGRGLASRVGAFPTNLDANKPAQSEVCLPENGHVSQTFEMPAVTEATGKENDPRSAKMNVEVAAPAVHQILLHPAALAALKDNPVTPEVETKLRALMQPLYCRLCSVHMNAESQAVQHYEGKNHAKKVRMFLVSSPIVTTTVTTQGSLLSSNGSTTTTTSGQSDNGVANTKQQLPEVTPVSEEVYCKVCDVSFTSIKQSTQHYQGKNHTKKLRLASNKSLSDTSFIKGEGTVYQCILCSIHVTTQDQLQLHLNGAKHKTKLGRMHQNGTNGDQGFRGVKRVNDPEVSIGLTSATAKKQNKRPRQDLSNFRTPSGKFYCSSCNVTLNVESQFAQHMTSKRHKTIFASRRNSSDNSDSWK